MAKRFVSYHFEQESEVCQYFEDTAIVLRQLTMRLNILLRRWTDDPPPSPIPPDEPVPARYCGR